jgi:hypothetical protein
MDDPLFKSANDALVYAFQFGKDWHTKNALATWVHERESKGRRGKGKGLIGFDGAAQAGMVLSEVGRLADAMKASIVCRYAIRRGHCSACGSATFTEAWREGIEELTEYVLPSVNGISPRQMRKRLVEHYFGEPVDMKDLSSKWDVSKSTAYNHRDAIHTCLRRLEDRAMVAAEQVLQEAQMVGTA